MNPKGPVFQQAKGRLTIVAAARPNLMKIAPLCRALELKAPHLELRTVFTATPREGDLEDGLLEAVGLGSIDCFLGSTSRRASILMSEVMTAFEEELERFPSKAMVAVDDSTASMAAVLVARKKGVPVIHLVAGTSQSGRQQGLEVNRTVMDAVSSLMLCSSQETRHNLMLRGVDPDRCLMVGNILLDGVRDALPSTVRPACIPSPDYVLVTLNRRELLEDTALLQALLTALEGALEAGTGILIPSHGYVREALEAVETGRARIVPSLGYLEFLWAEEHALMVVTDSGNVAEECTFLDTPAVILSDVTEHMEVATEGTALLTGISPERLTRAVTGILQEKPRRSSLPMGWDGRAAPRAAQAILEFLAKDEGCRIG